ncbi:MAG: nucleoside-diphosphate sugar epimerase/dehydratase, partial [Egibacteraceae bacterium]
MIFLGDAAALAAAAGLAGSASRGIWTHVGFCLIALAAVGSYRPRFNLCLLQHAPLLILILAVPALGLVAASTVLNVAPEMGIHVALAPVLLIAFRATTYSAVRMARRHGHLSEPVAVLGSGQVADALIRHMRDHPQYGLV